MDSDIRILTVAIAAFFGGILSAFMGWLDSKETFDPRKFAKSFVFALVSGIAFAAGYTFSDSVGTRDILVAILAGAGVDSISNRTIGALRPPPG